MTDPKNLLTNLTVAQLQWLGGWVAGASATPMRTAADNTLDKASSTLYEDAICNGRTTTVRDYQG